MSNLDNYSHEQWKHNTKTYINILSIEYTFTEDF